MIRVKYCLHQGIQPQDTIRATIVSINPSDMEMGRFFQVEGGNECYYGEINTDPSNATTIVSACANWNMVELTDQEAKDFADAAGAAPGTLVVDPQYTYAAEIIGGKVVRRVETTPPS